VLASGVLRRIAHVNLTIDDVDAARAFYGDLLGLTAVNRPGDAPGRGCWFVLGDVELHLSIEQGADNARSRRHVAFEVTDLAALRERITGAGVEIHSGSAMAGVERFFARDPAGNRLEFYVRTSRDAR
jgi:catechol 2,3-dioxygenase-like lactoylglutathione lyase family enzyme